MDFITWLDKEDGRAAAIASHFGLTRSAVSQWRSNGVPVSKMKAIRDFTQGEVTLEEMVPESTAKAA